MNAIQYTCDVCGKVEIVNCWPVGWRACYDVLVCQEHIGDIGIVLQADGKVRLAGRVKDVCGSSGPMSLKCELEAGHDGMCCGSKIVGAAAPHHNYITGEPRK